MSKSEAAGEVGGEKDAPTCGKLSNNLATDEYLGAGNLKYFCVFSPLVEEDLQVEEHIFQMG